ncbi:MAG: hypothetical protein R6V61_07850 [Wenzhouxiangellaceae bacterium]
MNDRLIRYLVIAAAVLGGVGLFIRPESGVDRMPGFYPLTAVLIITLVVLGVRVLARLLERPEDEYDAD